ncbi:LptF/LptG family permease [Flavobacterium sp.]|uniref:LptF/LptG family permease n=1 Tax=Flavobacterium sp. TaxID=239 RepID=UPI00345DE174
MKIIDRYLLKSFWITFASVFVILFFIFILQTVWLFISELAGKDLDTLMVIKFLIFAMPRIIPMVLPLSVLLASIMTFGSLAENYEFAAMKSSGISFQRSLRYQTYFILILTLVSFFVANNIIPYAEYKFTNFRRNIAQIKPALAIAEGQFSEIGNYNIKVLKKKGEKGNLLEGVTIHRNIPNGGGNTTVIKAKRGELLSSEQSNTLRLVLYDGTYYEDLRTTYEKRNSAPFTKATFKRDVFSIDLTKLNQNNQRDMDFGNTFTMLNISELNYTLDSLQTNYKKEAISYGENIYSRTGALSTNTMGELFPKKMPTQDILAYLTPNQKTDIYRYAYSNVENIHFTIDSALFEMNAKQKLINKHWIAIYDKFMLAFSCILMFFIGAPLGSIIRKGGIGLPIVFSVIIFIIFHFINTFGKRLAQENGIAPFFGVWMSTMILLPLAITLTYRAIHDIGGMVTLDVIVEPVMKLFRRDKSETTTEASGSTIDTPLDQPHGDLPYPNESADTVPVCSDDSHYDDLPQINEKQLGDIDLERILKWNRMALLYYAITFTLVVVYTFTAINYILIAAAIPFALLLTYCYKAQVEIDRYKLQFEPGLFISLLTAFPFYPILSWSTKKQVHTLIQNAIENE